MKPVASLLLILNLCMYIIVVSIGGWALNYSINCGFFIGPNLALPAHFSPIYFPMGNEATGFFVLFALIAGVVGAGACLAGIDHLKSWNSESLPSAASSGFIAWGLTLLAAGLACKEIHLKGRNTRLVCHRPAGELIVLYICADHHSSSYFFSSFYCREQWRRS